MRRGYSLIVAAVMFLWVASPVLACVIPERSMTAQEHQCCQHMRQMCGSPRMPRSHSCCRVEVRSSTILVTDHRTAPAPQMLAVLPGSVAVPQSASFAGDFYDRAASGSPPAVSVLRI